MEGRRREYRRWRPEEAVLYEAVRDHLATLLAEASKMSRGLPWYLVRDFPKYLACSVAEMGPERIERESLGANLRGYNANRHPTSYALAKWHDVSF